MSPETGARNMLLNCANARPGERILIAFEPSEFGYFTADVLPAVMRAAQDLGLLVETLNVGFSPYVTALSQDLKDQIEQSDIVVFLARLGDQLRFSDMPPGKRIIASFAVDLGLLGSAFGTVHHHAMIRLKDCVSEALARAESVRVTCPGGTDFHGKPDMPDIADGDTTVLRFPMSVFKPVPAHSFSGRVSICGFLTGTGARYYDGYTVEFDGPVFALMRDGRLTGFDGSRRDVDAANAHYDRIATMFGIDRDFVHSWHAGIHPGCGYVRTAQDNYPRWGGAAFGNPRILHFHTCGRDAPGEISWNVIDPTIWVDGVAVWERGVFYANRLPGGQDVLDRFPCASRIFAHPDRRVGLPEPRVSPVPGHRVALG